MNEYIEKKEALEEEIHTLEEECSDLDAELEETRSAIKEMEGNTNNQEYEEDKAMTEPQSDTDQKDGEDKEQDAKEEDEELDLEGLYKKEQDLNQQIITRHLKIVALRKQLNDLLSSDMFLDKEEEE